MAALRLTVLKPYILGVETQESRREALWQEAEIRRQAKEKRLNQRYKPSKVRFLYNFEEAVDTYYYTEDFSIMYKMLKATIKNKALAYGTRWKSKRLSSDDFESVFWEEAWKVCDNYGGGDYLLYETITLALERKAIDVIRKATESKQGRFERSALPLSDDFENFYPDSIDMEGEITNKIIVEQILNDEALTPIEKRFVSTMYQNPDAPLNQLAREMGFKHHEQARRMLEGIRTKLKKYGFGTDWHLAG